MCDKGALGVSVGSKNRVGWGWGGAKKKTLKNKTTTATTRTAWVCRALGGIAVRRPGGRGKRKRIQHGSKQNKSHEKSVIGPFIFIRHCFRYLRCAFSGRVGGS